MTCCGCRSLPSWNAWAPQSPRSKARSEGVKPGATLRNQRAREPDGRMRSHPECEEQNPARSLIERARGPGLGRTTCGRGLVLRHRGDSWTRPGAGYLRDRRDLHPPRPRPDLRARRERLSSGRPGPRSHLRREGRRRDSRWVGTRLAVRTPRRRPTSWWTSGGPARRE
jgi:hypothetical protein